MPLRAQIEAITATLPGNCTFIYGTANEINAKADKAERAKPIVNMYPRQPFTSGPQVNGSVTNEFNLYLEFLFIHDFGDDTAMCEALVNQALVLQNIFLNRLVNYREANGRYFKIRKGQRFNGMPVYNSYDCNMCGVSLTIKVTKRYNEYVLDC